VWPLESRYNFNPPAGSVWQPSFRRRRGEEEEEAEEGGGGGEEEDEEEEGSEVSLAVSLILAVKVSWWQGKAWRNEEGKVMGAIKYTAEETSLEVTTCRRTVCTGRQGRYLATNIGGGGGGGGTMGISNVTKESS